MSSIVFVIPCPLNEIPSQRFRFEQYFTILQAQGHTIVIEPFFKHKAWRRIYRKGSIGWKFYLISMGILRRTILLFRLPWMDFVFVHREAAPFGPPVFEWIAAKIFRKKIIYDFDDAIWKTDKLTEPFLEKILKWRSKTGTICSWSYQVSAGNQYLANFARTFNQHVVINPTTIETQTEYVPAEIEKSSGKIIIGWTGSRSTLKYFVDLIPALKKITTEFQNVEILVIADESDYSFPEKFTFKRWTKDTEVADIKSMDIGLMPLPDDAWANGKCGLKALQYMALAIPTVITPVGVNREIIQDGVNGFLCSTDDQWHEVLSRLIADHTLRKKIGSAGLKTVQENYSVVSNESRFVSLFQEA